MSRSVDACIADLPDEVGTLVLGVFASLADVPVSLIHGDPGSSNIRITDVGQVVLLDWDESRVDLTWHDLSNLGVTVLDTEAHRRAVQLSHAWEAINAWTAEPDYARSRLANLPE
jgi:aminoglycoside phosphotransferase (APT) family kinase protein